MRNRLLISFSGGETSALMTKLILEQWRDRYDEIRVIFANTGQEREETLIFVDRCDKVFGFNVVWIELVTTMEKGVGARCREVTFDTASRDGQPFEGFIAKYGIPGPSHPSCSKGMKAEPITRWARENGWLPGTYDLAIGIRDDEADRISPKAKKRRIIYPLIKTWPHTKPMVNEFWLKQPFRLDLKGYQGNCKWCWKKSLRKHLTIITETPEAYDFPERMEREYALAGNGRTGEPRQFFRGNRTVADLREIAATKAFVPATDDARDYSLNLLEWLSINEKIWDGALTNDDIDMNFDACGSGESCEVDFGDDS